MLPLPEVCGSRGEPWLEAVALWQLGSGDADSTLEHEPHTVVAMKQPVVYGCCWPGDDASAVARAWSTQCLLHYAQECRQKHLSRKGEVPEETSVDQYAHHPATLRDGGNRSRWRQKEPERWSDRYAGRCERLRKSSAHQSDRHGCHRTRRRKPKSPRLAAPKGNVQMTRFELHWKMDDLVVP